MKILKLHFHQWKEEKKNISTNTCMNRVKVYTVPLFINCPLFCFYVLLKSHRTIRHFWSASRAVQNKHRMDTYINRYTAQWGWSINLTVQALLSERSFPDTSIHPSIETLPYPSPVTGRLQCQLADRVRAWCRVPATGPAN